MCMCMCVCVGGGGSGREGRGEGEGEVWGSWLELCQLEPGDDVHRLQLLEEQLACIGDLDGGHVVRGAGDLHRGRKGEGRKGGWERGGKQAREFTGAEWQRALSGQ